MLIMLNYQTELNTPIKHAERSATKWNHQFHSWNERHHPAREQCPNEILAFIVNTIWSKPSTPKAPLQNKQKNIGSPSRTQCAVRKRERCFIKFLEFFFFTALHQLNTLVCKNPWHNLPVLPAYMCTPCPCIHWACVGSFSRWKQIQLKLLHLFTKIGRVKFRYLQQLLLQNEVK